MIVDECLRLEVKKYFIFVIPLNNKQLSMNSTTLTSSISYISKKSSLFKKFHYLSTPQMREAINIIISEARGIPLEDAKRKHFIRPKEFNVFLEKMGIV